MMQWFETDGQSKLSFSNSSPMLFAGLIYGVLCIGMAGLASLMGGILQVGWICQFTSLYLIVNYTKFCRLQVHDICRKQPCNLSDMCFFIQAAISIFGIIGGPLLGMFTLGVLCPFANSKVSLSISSFLLVLLFQ